MIVTMDISNAFNTIEGEAIRKELEEAGCPSGLRKLAVDFLRERTAHCGGVTKNVSRGCPQGSCTGPILWLVGMEGWFRRVKEIDGLHAQAYADDQVMIMSGTSVRKVEDIWRRTWEACKEWARQTGVRYNGDKTEAMFVGCRTVLRKPEISMDDTRIHVQRSIKYLGIVIEDGMMWIEHAKRIRGKTAEVANKLLAVAGRTWGTSPEMQKAIYRGAIAPMILYGAEVWGERTKDTRIKKHLGAAQRPFLVKAARAYRTASTSALQVITGLPPLDVEAGQRYMENRRLARNHELKPEAKGNIHPAQKGQLRYREWDEDAGGSADWEIYTDAAVLEDNRAGLACVARRAEGTWEEPVLARLPGHTTSSQAELKAIEAAVDLAKQREGDTDIITDSLTSLLAITAILRTNERAREVYKAILKSRMEGKTIALWWTKGHKGNEGNSRANDAARRAAEEAATMIEMPRARSLVKRDRKDGVARIWQEQWDSANTGRLLHGIVNRVDCEVGPVSKGAVQLLTGHGNMNGYFKRFRLKEGDGKCKCGVEETAEHIWWRCKLENRANARRKLQEEAEVHGAGWPLKINAETNIAVWAAINEFAEAALEPEAEEVENEE